MPKTLTPAQEKGFAIVQKFIAASEPIFLVGDGGSGKTTIMDALRERKTPNQEYITIDVFTVFSTPREANCSYLVEFFNDLKEQIKSIHTTGNTPIVIFDDHVGIDTMFDFSTPYRSLLYQCTKDFIKVCQEQTAVVFVSPWNTLRLDIFQYSYVIDALDHTQMLINCGCPAPWAEYVGKQFPNSSLTSTKNVWKALNVEHGEELLNFSKEKFYSLFLTAMGKTAEKTGNPIDTLTTCPRLIGTEEIFRQLTTHVIAPIKNRDKLIEPKRGLIICGAPGTGKTSIAKWLAFQMGGKFINFVPLNSNTILQDFKSKLNEAYKTSPSVLFVDDVDGLLFNPDVVRGFLTILDGVDDSKRQAVIIIFACMNAKTIPSPFIRGGRLEMILYTRLPEPEERRSLIEQNLQWEKNVPYSSIDRWVNQTEGWNCADITRAIKDLQREVEFAEIEEPNHLTIMDKIISSINRQYTKVGYQEYTEDKDPVFGGYL